jgi:hypothetical protein
MALNVGRSIYIYIQGVDVVEWSRALDVRLSEWCCSVTMVWVQIPSREKKNLTALKSNSNTVWFNVQTYIYIYIYIYKHLKWFVKQHQVHKTK